MADPQFIVSNPAVDEMTRANKVADDEATSQLQREGQQLMNRTAALKLQTDTAEAPTRLRMLNAQADTATTNAQYAAPKAQADIAASKAQVANVYSEISNRDAARHMEVFTKALALANSGDIEGAKAVAAQNGETIPPEILNNAAVRAGITQLTDRATALYANRPKDQMVWLHSHISTLAQAAQSGQPIDPTAAYTQLPGDPEPAAATGGKFGVIGENDMGVKQYGFADANTQTVTPVGPQSNEAPKAGDPALQVHGQAFLDTLDPTLSNQVKALAEGRMAFPSGFALKSPYWQHMLQAVSQYDPTFDAVNYNSRSKTRADFTSGKSAQNITALNTVIGHLGSLLQESKQLNNTSFLPLNRAINSAETMSGDPRYNNFDLARNAVADELSRVFRQTGMSDTEVNQWKSTLNSAMSYEQVKGAVATALHLLDSRLQAVGEQYTRGMGTTSNPVKLLSPNSQRILQQIQAEVGSDVEFPTNVPGGSGAPVSGNSQGGVIPPADHRVVGQTYQTPKGPAVWMGNGWQLGQ